MGYQYPFFKMMGIFIMLRVNGKETESIEKSINEYIEFFVKQIYVEE